MFFLTLGGYSERIFDASIQYEYRISQGELQEGDVHRPELCVRSPDPKPRSLVHSVPSRSSTRELERMEKNDKRGRREEV